MTDLEKSDIEAFRDQIRAMSDGELRKLGRATTQHATTESRSGSPHRQYLLDRLGELHKEYRRRFPQKPRRKNTILGRGILDQADLKDVLVPAIETAVEPGPTSISGAYELMGKISLPT